LEQLRTEVVDLLDAQAAVVGHDQRLGRPQALGQLRDDPLLVSLLHTSPSTNNARTEAGTEKTSFTRTASAGLLPLSGCPLSSANGPQSRGIALRLARGYGLLCLFDDVARPRRVDVDARAHCRRQRDRADVA